MRRLYRLIKLLAAIIVGGIVYNHTREDRWRPFPGGESDWRLVGITNEKNAQFKIKGSILEPLRSMFGPRWNRLLPTPPLSVTSQQNGLVFWFQIHHDAPKYTGFSDNDIVYSLVIGDKVIHSSGSDGAGRGEHKLMGVAFAPTPSLIEPRFHLRLLRNDKTLDFDVANPFYTPPPSETPMDKSPAP